MRQLVLGLGLAVAISGCSAAKSAMSVLSPKPPSVTVVTNVSTSQPAVVVDKPKAKQRGFFEKVGIVTTTTIVGAGLGALAGDALDADVGTAALLGAAAGGVTGVAIVKD
jgi:hypothetical protein